MLMLQSNFKINWPLPVECQKITSRHGINDHIGIDVSCASGTPVYASHDGVVSFEVKPKGGNCVNLTAIGGERTHYAHLLSYTVREWAQVKTGDKIAISNNTGVSTGAHLHFELWINGVAVDPLLYMEGYQAMSKIALHFQNYPEWAKSVVAQYWGDVDNDWVKCIDPPFPDMFTNTHILGRSWLRGDNNDWERDQVARGAAGGDEIFNFRRAQYEQMRGIVTAWEFVNEPKVQELVDCEHYAEAFVRWNYRMHSIEIPTCGGSLSVGSCKVMKYDGWNQGLIVIGQAIAQADLYSYHGYWAKPYDSNDDWWCHRYRLYYSECAAAGIQLPPVMISETSVEPGGWKKFYATWNEFFGDVQLYSADIGNDSNVKRAFFFVSGAGADWLPFDIDQAQATDMGRFKTGNIDPLLEYAEKFVIAQNQEAGLYKYIINQKGWDLASGEFGNAGWTWQWGFDATRNVRILCRAQAPSWQIQEYTTVPN
jgi:hypothetical protein